MPYPPTSPTIRIALEWYLNPDHLPLIHATERAREDGALAVELIAPDDHYDGFEALAQGKVELVVNEPLHLLEKHIAGLELQSLGTFFHTDGGVLITHDAQARLRSGGAIRVASPVSNPVTDNLCKDILIGWFRKQGASVTQDQISVEEAGFDHVTNLANGADAAWLAFANIEGVHARHLDLPVDMCRTSDGDIPGFSALELIANRDSDPHTRAALAKFVEYLDTSIRELQADPAAALALWCRASNTEASDLTRAMVTDTLTRFVFPVSPDAARWRPIWAHMREQGSDVVDTQTFDRIFEIR